MLSINTNLQSLIAQKSLSNSTLLLNQAIERMTTGYKINHAKDNAANYSIATDLSTKIGAYQVAEDNCAMGMDLVTTSMECLDVLSAHLSKIRALAEQAANGTYGKNSLDAIQAEANARLEECNRLINSSEYNGIKLFKTKENTENMSNKIRRMTRANTARIASETFIKDVDKLTESEALAQGYTIIKTADDLQNIKNNLSGKYILMNDIDLSGISWTPVGSETSVFNGELNGNGNAIKSLTVDSKKDNQGLFGVVGFGTIIQNLAIKNADVKGNSSVGAIVGKVRGNTTITNSYSTGKVESYTTKEDGTGGLVGNVESGEITMTNCFSKAIVIGDRSVGGLIGWRGTGKISNCYFNGQVSGNSEVGGLVGKTIRSNIENCSSSGTISGNSNIGGLVGRHADYSTIINSYSTATPSGKTNVGILIGSNSQHSTIKNSYFDSDTSNSGLGEDENDGETDVSGISKDELDKLINNGTLFNPDTTPSPEVPDTDKTSPDNISFQVGIHGDANSRISVKLGYSFNLTVNLMSQDSARTTFIDIDNSLAKLNSRQIEFGACYNRLESALEEINTHYENISSSRSTLKDADIADVSSEYIRQQILQQASATLLATANQSPSLALQLI